MHKLIPIIIEVARRIVAENELRWVKYEVLLKIDCLMTIFFFIYAVQLLLLHQCSLFPGDSKWKGRSLGNRQVERPMAWEKLCQSGKIFPILA